MPRSDRACRRSAGTAFRQVFSCAQTVLSPALLRQSRLGRVVANELVDRRVLEAVDAGVPLDREIRVFLEQLGDRGLCFFQLAERRGGVDDLDVTVGIVGTALVVFLELALHDRQGTAAATMAW
jgi:hypothetical protein